MKILSIKLENFNMIKNAMNTNSLFIDFSESINKICLIIGPNGSGKTTLLSMLHPFADLGNLDIRNGTNLIISGKDGYKEIVIKKNDDIYTIKHYYTPHSNKNHSVKSYIEKNGTEMNVNGNVTSFKEFVKYELQIEPDYLKLIRLGSNVTSLIDLSATERKNFMSKIMDDIGIFLEYYKSVNTKLRQLDEMISHEVDKEKRLGILDKEEYQREIDELETLLKKYNDEYIKLNGELSILKKTISDIEDVDNLQDNLKEVSKKYKKMLSILERKDQIEKFDVEYYASLIQKLEIDSEKCKSEIENNTELIQNSLEHLNSLQEQLRGYKVQLTKEEESDKELDRMTEIQTTLRKKLREYEEIIGDFEPKFSKGELEDFIIFLKNSQQILTRTYEFGKPAIKKVIELMRKNKNVIHYINSHLIDIDEKEKDNGTSVFINTLASRFVLGKEETVALDCDKECPAKNLYNQISNILKNSEVSDKNEDSSFYRDMEFIYNNLMSILPNFNTYKSLIENLPDNIKVDFTLESIYSRIETLQSIYDGKKVNELLSLVTEIDNYQKVLNDYNFQTEMIQKFSSLSNLGNTKKQVHDVEKEIESIREKILNWKEKNILLTEQLADNGRSLEVYSDVKETIEKFDEIKSLFEKYTKEYELFSTTYEQITKLSGEIAVLKTTIENTQNKKKQMEIDLSQYISLHKEIKKMNRIYDEMTYVKESLSSKEGMPLRFIGNYLRNTEEITNELLDIAYDGKIFLDSFEISATEFSMPFYNKGIRLDDVKYASQGELSFLSIALAFALSSQALSKYNIMLLDEVDGPLDTTNREKFIRIMERQIDRINAEQSFLITHNVMFSAYPVDILDFSFKNDTEQYPLANFIKIER